MTEGSGAGISVFSVSLCVYVSIYENSANNVCPARTAETAARFVQLIIVALQLSFRFCSYTRRVRRGTQLFTRIFARARYKHAPPPPVVNYTT